MTDVLDELRAKEKIALNAVGIERLSRRRGRFDGALTAYREAIEQRVLAEQPCYSA